MFPDDKLNPAVMLIAAPAQFSFNLDLRFLQMVACDPL